jgi:molybdenum cofactor guanylyltransferase
MACVTGGILAGGAAKRMGGRPKGLMLHGAQPLIAHVIAAIAPQVGTVMVSANRYLDAYAQWHYPVYPDVRVDTVGPLGGIERLLIECPTRWLMVVPCDAPHPPGDLVAQLLAAAERHDAVAAYANAGGRAHYTHCLLDRALRPSLSAWLDGGGRPVGAWLATTRPVAVDFADPSAFLNINTLEQLNSPS